MKVLFNQSLYVSKNTLNNGLYKKSAGEKNEKTLNCYNVQMPISMLINFSNISFGMDSGAKFLLNQTDKLLCAYSGKEMLSPTLVKKIYDKIPKLPNLQSAVNYLFQYQDRYMHDIESQIFDIFNDKEVKKYYGRKTFKDVLEDYQPESLARLKNKQFKILTSTDGIIRKLSDPVKDLVTIIRNDSISKIENDTFGRKSPLEMLCRIKASGKDYDYLKSIYKMWYKLPSSSTDIDAFIVSYSKMSHAQICKRLLSPSVASIEHIKPQSRGGGDFLSNYLLVSAEYNNNRGSLPLNEYIELHPELNIPNALQIYMDLVIKEINTKNSDLSGCPYYAYDIAETIGKETKGKIQLVIENISAPNKKIHEKDFLAKQLAQKYPTSKN